MSNESSTTEANPDEKCSALNNFVSALVGKIPESSEKLDVDPDARSRSIAHTAAIHAAMTSGALALPPGPVGWLTILPDIAAIWKIQAQMIADIAAVHGKKELLTRENLLYCMFRHSDVLAVRELAVQVGERLLFQRASGRIISAIVRRIGARLATRLVGEGLTRLLPVIGAIGVGAFAYYDTGEVARTASKLFSRDMLIAAPPSAKISLKAFNGGFVCADFSQGGALVADRNQNLEWEHFTLTPLDAAGGVVALQACNGAWWCCDGDAGCRLSANREKLDAWETFRLERISENQFQLRAHNNQLVYADAERGYTLWADRDVSGESTFFSSEPVVENE